MGTQHRKAMGRATAAGVFAMALSGFAAAQTSAVGGGGGCIAARDSAGRQR